MGMFKKMDAVYAKWGSNILGAIKGMEIISIYVRTALPVRATSNYLRQYSV